MVFPARLTVLREISRSHDEGQKSYGKDIHKPMENTFLEYFYFCLVKIDFLSHSLTMVVGWSHRSQKYRQLDFNDALNVTARCSYELCCQSIFDSVAV